MERLFRIIGRVNNVLFLLLVLCIGGFILFEISSTAGWERGGEVTAIEEGERESREVRLRFGEPARVFGSSAIMLPLLGTEESDGLIGSKSEYSEVRNQLFLNAEGKATWLFGGSGNRIFEVKQVEETGDLEAYRPYEPDPSEPGPTKLLLVGFVASADFIAADRARGPMRIALASPDGSGLVEILKGVDSLLSYGLSRAGDLTVIYQSGATVHRAIYAIDGFRETSNTVIAEIPKNL